VGLSAARRSATCEAVLLCDTPGTSEKVGPSHITLYSQNMQHRHAGSLGVFHRLRFYVRIEARDAWLC